jgi:acyl-CoA hydrolase
MATVSPWTNMVILVWELVPSAFAALENARAVILEINTNMPRVLGGNQESIHISQVDYVLESSNMPLLLFLMYC